jgi:hypothetical protein
MRSAWSLGSGDLGTMSCDHGPSVGPWCGQVWTALEGSERLLGTHAIVLAAIRQDHSHLAQLFQQVRTVRITSYHPDPKQQVRGPDSECGIRVWNPVS